MVESIGPYVGPTAVGRDGDPPRATSAAGAAREPSAGGLRLARVGMLGALARIPA
jgi:hypothetical protein